MTATPIDSTDVTPTIGGSSALTILRRRHGEIVEAILAALVAEVDRYAELPADALQIDIRTIIQRNLRIFEEGLGGAAIPPAALEELIDSATNRAQEGLPLDLIQSAYLTAARSAWWMGTEQAGPEDVQSLRRLGVQVLEHLREALGGISRGYVEEVRMSSGQSQSLTTTLLNALLQGGGVEAAAEAAGVELPNRYLIAALDISPRPDENPPGPGADVAARRKVRDVRVALLRAVTREPLIQINASGGLIFFPAQSEDSITNETLDHLRSTLAKAAGADVRMGIAWAEPTQAPVAIALARDLLAVARSVALEPGVHRLEDLLLEYQLSRPSPAATALVHRLRPLTEHPDIMLTLRTHLATHLSRAETARRLTVHPNTVDYRLGRVTKLVGLDPSVPHDLMLLRAGLVAMDAWSERYVTGRRALGA